MIALHEQNIILMFNSVWWQSTLHPLAIISVYKLTLDSRFGARKQRMTKKNWLFSMKIIFKHRLLQTKMQMWPLTHARSHTNTNSRAQKALLHLTHIDFSLLGFSPLTAGPALLGVYILLCFACVRTEQEEIKAALPVCLQPTLLKRIAVEYEKEEA